MKPLWEMSREELQGHERTLHQLLAHEDGLGEHKREDRLHELRDRLLSVEEQITIRDIEDGYSGERPPPLCA